MYFSPPQENDQQTWWYCTDHMNQKGPVSTHQLVSLFVKAEIDGLTLVSDHPSTPTSNCLPLSEHPQLAEAVRNHHQSEHEPEHEPEHHLETHFNNQQPQQPQQQTPLQSRPNPKTAEQRERKRLSRKRARKAANLRNRQNTSIYITGIPPDTTEPELSARFVKCGIILPNPETGRPRVKLYRNPDHTLKGDALITYALRPSVDNAISILDGVPLRDGTSPLTVKEATFDHKEPQDGNQGEERNKRPRIPIRGRDLVEEALSWSEDHQAQKGAPRIVILKNVFDPASAEYDIIREDMKEGCEACGEVEKLTVFESNEEGAVAVKFTSVDASLKCINIMNGRWYDGRKLHAAFYDGQTNYTHRETDQERKKREQKWEDWISGDRSTSAGHIDDKSPQD